MNNIVKKVMIYPFYDEFIPIVKFLNKLNPELIVYKLVAPMGFGLQDKDAGEAYRKNTIGLKVTNNFDEAIADSDILFVTNGYKCVSIYKDILNKIKKAINMEKEIICTLELASEQLSELINLSKRQDTKFTYYNAYENMLQDVSHIENYEMKKIHVPIIYIGEMLDGFGGFEMLLKTTLYLKKQGYNVLSIGKPKYSDIFNIQSMPRFIYETGIKDENKVYSFNAYIYKLQKNLKPDVIVIQLPDSLFRYNNEITNQFGIYSYIVSQAVSCDYFIYCSECSNLGTKMLKMLNKTFKYRFGFEINALNIVNKCLTELNTVSHGELSLLWFEQSAIEQSIQRYYSDSPIPVYNCENYNHNIELFEKMIDTLTKYGEVSNFT